MSAPIPFLSALVLICVAFPTQLFRVAMMAVDVSKAGGRLLSRVGLAVFCVAVAALAWYVAPVEPQLLPDVSWWLLGAVAVGAVAPAWEIGLGYLIGWAGRRRPTGFSLHDRSPSGSVAVTLAAVVVAGAEEVIFRGIGLGLLTGPLGWAPVVAIALTSVVYGLNHLYFGWLTVAQKTVTGAVFGVLWLLSGGLLVPIVAHVAQNLVVLTILPRFESPSGKAVR